MFDLPSLYIENILRTLTLDTKFKQRLVLCNLYYSSE